MFWNVPQKIYAKVRFFEECCGQNLHFAMFNISYFFSMDQTMTLS